jgi:hypothetical protein
MTHSFRAAAAVISGLAVAACGSGSAAVHLGAASGGVSQGAASAAASARASARAAAAKATALREAAARKAAEPRVTLTRVRTSDGSQVTVAIFRGTVRYALHDGSQDPYARPGLLKDGSFVGQAERAHLLAAFNGGFKMVAGAGGYEQEGHVLYPLRAGLASLVIDRSGHARIVVWPVRGEQAYSVRQNLRPLVLDGRPASAAFDWGVWGATLGGGEYVARSAVGENAAGDLMYVGSMSTTPYDLAWVLAREGARTAMELDINPAWVQLDVARHPGGGLRAEVAGQNRPASQYLYGWTRDFFTVLG